MTLEEFRYITTTPIGGYLYNSVTGESEPIGQETSNVQRPTPNVELKRSGRKLCLEDSE